jgi:altronate dehydratase small subunit
MKGIVLDDIGLLLSAADNVATAINNLEAGQRISLADHPESSRIDNRNITLNDDVPFGHKFALVSIADGEPVSKYGETIGKATDDIAPGEWVHTHNCESARGRGDLAGERSDAVAEEGQ